MSESGADVNIVDKYDETVLSLALFYAVYYGKTECLELLLNYKSNEPSNLISTDAEVTGNKDLEKSV